MFKNRNDNYTFLTRGPIHQVIGTMAVPTIISMLVTSLYNIVDTYFVGQLDTQSTAAVGVVFSVMYFMQAFGFFFGHGSGNYMSRELGARHRENAVRMAATGFTYSMSMGLVIMMVGLLLLHPLSVWLGSTPTVLPYTERYLSIILLGAPFLTASLTLNNQMRLQGNAVYAMYGIVSGAVLNVVLDPLLIFVFQLGITGAAMATVAGQILSFSILFYMSGRGENIPIRLRNFTPSMEYLREIVYGGSPSLSRQGLSCVATMLMNVAASAYGDAAIAGMTIVNRITMLTYSAIVGFGQGFQPLCGFCYGARLYERVKEAFWYCVKVGTAFLLCCTIIGALFAPEAIGLFRDDPAVIRVGAAALRYQLLTYPLGALLTLSNMLLQTCRKPWRANILAAARCGLFFIPLILILPSWWHLLGVEICQAVSDMLAFLVTLPVLYTMFRELNAQEQKN